jgi:hypothetical protein
VTTWRVESSCSTRRTRGERLGRIWSHRTAAAGDGDAPEVPSPPPSPPPPPPAAAAAARDIRVEDEDGE